jgi:hypothetical protein
MNFYEEWLCGSEDMILAEKESEQDLYENNLWETRDGSIISIASMTTTHIKNCIRMIYKANGNWRPEYLRLFEKELRKRKYD